MNTTDTKANILLVDDDASNLLALEATLEGLGQNLFRASSGREALRFVLNNQFAVVLLDLQMPDMTGIEAATLIRERERSRHTPIIFLTGAFKTDEMMFKGYSTGAVDYLLKPVIPAILRAKVEVFVELARARQKLQNEIAERIRGAEEVSKLNMVLAQRNQALTAANADLEAFGYSVSHDLGAPLRHIRGYIKILQDSIDSRLNEDERRLMETIHRSAERMGQLIDALLSFARIGRGAHDESRVSLERLVKETLAEIQPDLSARNIVWEIGPLPDVRGNQRLLAQVLFNLVSNAVKYTRPRDAARIEIGCQEGAGHEIVVFVRDNGVGFDPMYTDKLFGVFQRFHTEEVFEGTGIGLANVRRIISHHGGRTWAEGKPNEGATFYFSLPRADVAS
jgi:hypothetical protein